MEIYIPTYGRVDQQFTLDNLPPVWADACTLVVYREEAPHHVERGRKVLVVGDEWKRGIPTKRQFIMDHACHNKVVMLDDDLTFARRRDDDPTKFRQMHDQDYHEMFGAMDLAMDGFYHGGLGFREGGNRYPMMVRMHARIMRAHFYRKDMPATFPRHLMEDFHVTMRLLMQGLDNIQLNRWVTNQRSSNLAGGVSEVRTPEVQKAAALAMAADFPQFVKVQEVSTKSSWGGGTRYDVRVQWKKAIKWGLEHGEPGQATLLDEGKRVCKVFEGLWGSETVVY